MAEKIKVNFLGTGSAVPTERRNHTSMFLTYKDEGILFDCGEGTQRQFRKAKISMNKITRILLSHWHGDHMLGLPGLFQSMIMNGYNKELKFYGPKGTKKNLSFLLDFFRITDRELNLEVIEVSSGTVFETEEILVECLPMDHGAPTNAYSFTIKEKSRVDKEKLTKLKLPNGPHLKALSEGKKIKIGDKIFDGKKILYTEPMRKITFIVDSRYNENAIELSKDSDLLICESSFSKEEAETAKDHGHMTSHEASSIAKKSKSKNLALIHLSQRYDAIPKKILAESKEIFKECFIPEDLDSIEV